MTTRDIARPPLGLAAIGVLAIAMLLAWTLDAGGAKIHVSPPPPPPQQQDKPTQTFDYSHTIKKVQRDRKPVIALLRPGDVVALQEYLPFGRGTTITKGETVDIINFGRPDDPVRLPAAIRPFLVRELLQTGEFIVVERERILEIARELALSKTQAVSPDTAPKPGRLIGVHYIVEASYWPVGGLPADDPALEPVRREIAKRRLAIDPRSACTLYLTVYKVETGEVKAVAVGTGLQPMIAVKNAVEDLLDQLGDIVEPIRVAKVDPKSGLALLDIGAEDGTRVGDVFCVSVPGAAGQQPASVTAEVVEVKPLSSVVKMPPDSKLAGVEGQEARRQNPSSPSNDKPSGTADQTSPTAPPAAPVGGKTPG